MTWATRQYQYSNRTPTGPWHVWVRPTHVAVRGGIGSTLTGKVERVANRPQGRVYRIRMDDNGAIVFKHESQVQRLDLTPDNLLPVLRAWKYWSES